MFSKLLKPKSDQAVPVCKPLSDAQLRDRVRGSIFAGAVGDALGYPIEFWNEKRIFGQYGKKGIRQYHMDPTTGTAIISDDTQMTLFTISSLLFGMYRQNERGVSADPRHYAMFAYLGWLVTQTTDYSQKALSAMEDFPGWASFLVKDVPELDHRRAPGITCLSALNIRKEQLDNHEHIGDYTRSKINDSKGCGGIMRVAPLGLVMHHDHIDRLDMEGAQLAAITHSHSLGYMCAAVLTHILSRILRPGTEMTLKQIVEEARDTVAALFREDPHIDELTRIIDLSIALSENNKSDLSNIHKIGEGWVGEETLGIAIYCSLKYQNDFSKAITVSVNHKGDSDSTGAVTGNIMGALVGYDAIEEKWKKDLELGAFILDSADKLYDAFCVTY